jgi:hypothetical protein
MDCETCIEANPRDIRQTMGCGYEPPSPDADPWEHLDRKLESYERDDDGRLRLPVCPGYLCKLPEVYETARARVHWEKGALRDFCGGTPSDHLLTAVEILDAAVSAFQAWSMKPAEEGDES